MVRIVSFTYCESIQNEMLPLQQGQTLQGQISKAHLIGPLLSINPISIPGNFSFSISIGIQGFNSNEKNTFQLRFVDPDGNTINDTNKVEIPQGIPKGNMAQDSEGIQINFDVRNLVFFKEGDYKTLVYFNEDLLGEYPILVTKAVI